MAHITPGGSRVPGTCDYAPKASSRYSGPMSSMGVIPKRSPFLKGAVGGAPPRFWGQVGPRALNLQNRGPAPAGNFWYVMGAGRPFGSQSGTFLPKNGGWGVIARPSLLPATPISTSPRAGEWDCGSVGEIKGGQAGT